MDQVSLVLCSDICTKVDTLLWKTLPSMVIRSFRYLKTEYGAVVR